MPVTAPLGTLALFALTSALPVAKNLPHEDEFHQQIRAPPDGHITQVRLCQESPLLCHDCC